MKKNSHYRRIIWLGEHERDLGDIFENCLEAIGDDELPRFPIGDGLECLIARKSLAGGNRYLHFIEIEAGAPVAIVNTIADEAAAGIQATEQEPDDGQEFIQSQLFCLVRGNHVIWTTHNSALRENSIRNIFASLIERGGLGGDANNTQFGFQVVLDDAVVMQAFQNGIQEIDLGLGAFRPTLARIAEGGELPEDGILAKIASAFRERPTAEQIEAAEHVEGKFVLKPGRDWERPQVMDLLTTMSEGIHHEYEDEFVIVTKSGVRLTKDKMSLQRPFEVEGNKRILASAQVDVEMRNIMASLIQDGILDV